MANQIRFKRASGSDPGASDLVLGEPAVRTDTGELFLKKDDGSVAKVSGGGIDDGDKGDITVSNSGATFTIDSGVIDNANINASAAIVGTKIDPDFGSQNIVTTGNLSVARINPTAPVTLPDSVELRLGTGEDLELVHDGSNSIIKGKTGETRIQCANTFKLTNSDNTETHIKATLNGDVELFFDNARKLETTSNGIDITGSISLSGLVDGRNIENDGTKLDGIESGATADQSASEIVALIADQTIAPSTIDMEDNEKIKLGASDDLEIYHDGSNSFISETGTGDLKILTGTLQLKNAADNKFNILINSAGVVELYHNGSSKFATSSSGVSVTGNIAVSGTVDGRDLATDGSKLDGIASGATNVTNTNQLTNGAGFITSADGGNAATLDGVDSSQFIRSDANDSASGLLSLSTGLSFGSDSRCAAGVSSLSDGSTITVDFTSGIHHSVTLGGNRTFGNPSNDGNAVGQSGSIFITQDGSGSRTASFHGDYKFAGGTAPTLSTGANAVDRIDYVIKSSGVIHCAFTADIK
tara:strand:- start:1965 stop:3551 length:1587 start_codon:yes stop_codon:yes gene_type:complete